MFALQAVSAVYRGATNHRQEAGDRMTNYEKGRLDAYNECVSIIQGETGLDYEKEVLKPLRDKFNFPSLAEPEKEEYARHSLY